MIDNVTLYGFDWYTIGLVSVYNAHVINNRITGVWYNGITGSIFYGVAVVNDSAHVFVHNNYATRERHLFVCVGYTYIADKYYGVPFDVVVSSNIAVGMEYGDGGSSYAYEHHGQGFHIVIENNIANGCYAGCNIEGSNVLVQNNKFYNCEVAGVIIGDAMTVSYVTIQNNMISGVVPRYVTAPRYAGILFDENHVTLSTGILISNNLIQFYNKPAIYMSGYPASNISIKGNMIVQTSSYNEYAVILNSSQASYRNDFSENTLIDCLKGIATAGVGAWDIHGNTIEGRSSATYGIVISDTADIDIIGNIISGFTTIIDGIGSPTIRAFCMNYSDDGSISAGVTITKSLYNVIASI